MRQRIVKHLYFFSHSFFSVRSHNTTWKYCAKTYIFTYCLRVFFICEKLVPLCNFIILLSLFFDKCCTAKKLMAYLHIIFVPEQEHWPFNNWRKCGSEIKYKIKSFHTITANSNHILQSFLWQCYLYILSSLVRHNVKTYFRQRICLFKCTGLWELHFVVSSP